MKAKFCTSISVDEHFHARAEKLRDRGVSYIEIFRKGVEICEDMANEIDKKRKQT